MINLPTTVFLSDSFGRVSDFAVAIAIVSMLANSGMAVLPLLIETWREKYGLMWAVALLGSLLWNNIPFCQLMSSDSPSVRQRKLERSESRQSTVKGKAESRNLFVSHPSTVPYYITRLIFSILLTTWAMFLVPFATQKGFDQSVAVFLSTVGGAGLFTGRSIAVAIFYFDKITSMAHMVPPVLSVSIMFVLYLICDSFVPLAVVTFVVATGIGVLSSWVFGFIKAVCCQFHFKVVASWAATISGIGSITAGFTSGK